MYYISVALILTELFHLEYLNLQTIISRSSNWISINRPPFDSSYREESNDMYYISVALILTEIFRFEFYNKNLTLFTLFRPYFDPISTLGGSRTRPFRPWGFNFGFMYTNCNYSCQTLARHRYCRSLAYRVTLYIISYRYREYDILPIPRL